jgi:putative nucleotidyltransferase with HDIG domain
MTDKAPNMVPVPISEFVSGATVPVDLFVKIGDDKFILVAKKDSKTSREQLETYETKAVFYIWVKKHEYATLVKANLTIAGIIVRHESLDTKQKTHVLTNAAGQVFRQLDEMGISMEAYTQAKQIVDATICLAESHKDLAELFAALAEVSDHLLKHSMAVCAVSTLIAQTMKWDSRATIEKVALGALLHDIGKKALPSELLTKPKAKMTHEETLQYESHTFKGMQMLLGLGVVPDDVIAIVYEHHENALGMGFPRKLRNLKMHPLARIVALANEFVDLTMGNPNLMNPKSPREALLTIETTMGQPFAKEVFKALTHVVTKTYLDGAA